MTDPASRKLEKARLSAFDDNIEAATGCGPGIAIREYLDSAYDLAGKITQANSGSGNTNRIEKGLVKAFNGVIDGANGCSPGIAIRGYLDLAYELADKVVAVEGGFKGYAASKVEEGLLRAFNNLTEGACGCEPGIAQKGYLALADEVAGKIASIENGLSKHAVAELAAGFSGVLDRAIERAGECSPGIAQKEWLALADKIENKIAAVKPPVLPDEAKKAIAVLNNPKPAAPG